MKFARVLKVTEDVEVVLKKVIVNSKEYGISMNFISENKNKEMLNSTTVASYTFRKQRDASFEEITKYQLIDIASSLPTFKDLVKPDYKGYFQCIEDWEKAGVPYEVSDLISLSKQFNTAVLSYNEASVLANEEINKLK